MVHGAESLVVAHRVLCTYHKYNTISILQNRTIYLYPIDSHRIRDFDAVALIPILTNFKKLLPLYIVAYTN